MKRHITYMDCETGEITENHEIAMIWYRKRHNIALMDYSETLGEWVKRGEWVW